MIIAVDFDGTLCTDAYPKIGRIISETADIVRRFSERGDTIILYTCKNAVRWCKKHNIPIDFVNENVPERAKIYGSDCRKISADIYIEDKSINFSKNLNKIRSYLLE